MYPPKFEGYPSTLLGGKGTLRVHNLYPYPYPPYPYPPTPRVDHTPANHYPYYDPMMLKYGVYHFLLRCEYIFINILLSRTGKPPRVSRFTLIVAVCTLAPSSSQDTCSFLSPGPGTPSRTCRSAWCT